MAVLFQIILFWAVLVVYSFKQQTVIESGLNVSDLDDILELLFIE